MDKNIKDKLKQFLKKEGFYVGLLVVLCILATVAVASMNKTKDTNNTNKEFSLDTKDTSSQKNNAERVEQEKNSEVAQEEQSSQEVTDETIETSAEVQVQFVNPIDGKLAREYTYPKPIKISDNTYRNVKGIDIVATIGTPVKVAAQGVVEEIGEQADEGVFIVVDHGNGLKTKYSNLDKTIEIKKGDKVAADTVIGKVGETAKIFSNKLFGEHLNLQVIDTNGKQVDPTQFFKYEIKE